MVRSTLACWTVWIPVDRRAGDGPGPGALARSARPGPSGLGASTRGEAWLRAPPRATAASPAAPVAEQNRSLLLIPGVTAAVATPAGNRDPLGPRARR